MKKRRLRTGVWMFCSIAILSKNYQWGTVKIVSLRSMRLVWSVLAVRISVNHVL